MLSQLLIDRRTRSHGCPEAALLPPIDPAPLRIHRDHQIQASNGSGFEVRWHVGGPWPAQAPAAIGALRGFHHATLEPSATWPMHIQEDLKGVTYVVAGALEHADNLGNRGVLTAGGVHQRWLGWGSEHEEWNPSPFAPTEFIQLWFEMARPHPTILAPTHYASHERFEHWLQIVDSDRASQDASVHVARLNPSTGCMQYRFKPGRGGYIYVIEGDVQVNYEHMEKRDAARVTGAGLVNIETSQPTELLIVDVSI